MNAAIVFLAEYLYLVIVLVAAAVFIYLPHRERKRILMLAAVVLPLAYVVARIAALFYFNPRPFVLDNTLPLVPHLPDNGFPSDHTLFAASIATVVFCFRRHIGIFLGALALLVGIGRVAAHVHHGVDVVGSVLIVLAVTAFVYYVVFKGFRSRSRS